MRGKYILLAPHAQPVHTILHNLFTDDVQMVSDHFACDKPFHRPAVYAGDEERSPRLELLPLNQYRQSQYFHCLRSECLR